MPQDPQDPLTPTSDNSITLPYMQMVDQLQAAQPQGNSVPNTGLPGIDPAVIQEVTKRALNTPEQLLQEMMKRHFGMTPDQTAPTTGQKVKAGALEVLKALFQSNYQNPRQRYQAIINQQFPEETKRLGTISPIAHMETQYQIAQDKINQLNQQLAEKTRHNTNLEDLAKQKEKDQSDARNLRNDILKLNVTGLNDLRDKEGALAQARQKITQFQIDHPNIKPGQMLGMLTGAGDEEMSPEDQRKLLNSWMEINVAGHPFTSLGTTTTSGQDAAGVQHTQATKNFVGNLLGRTMGLNGLSGNSNGNGLGAPSAPPTQIPSGVPAQGAPGVTPPAAPPQAPSLNPMDLVDPTKAAPGLVGRNVNSARLENAKKREEAAKQAGQFQLMANEALGNLTDAITSGDAKKFQGFVQGHPLMTYLRSTLGDVSPAEALQKPINLDLLFGKLGLNVRGRFTVPEIGAHNVTMGNMSQKPENALQAIMALKAQMEAQKMYQEGKLNPEDGAQVAKVAKAEMARVQQALAQAKGNPGVAAKMATTGELQMKPLDQLLAADKLKNIVTPPSQNSSGITMDDIDKEIARRKGQKK